MIQHYLLLKSAHVVAVLIFVGGMLSHHSALRTSGLAAERQVATYFSRAGTTMAMFAVWGFGIMMASTANWFSADWLRLKFVFVLILSAVHGVQSGCLRRGGVITHRAKSILLALILTSIAAIVLLAIYKPQF